MCMCADEPPDSFTPDVSSTMGSTTNTSSGVGKAPPTYQRFLREEVEPADDDNPPEYDDDYSLGGTREAGSPLLVTSPYRCSSSCSTDSKTNVDDVINRDGVVYISQSLSSSSSGGSSQIENCSQTETNSIVL